jgi:cysteinyl-tRNA synthetase
MTSNHILKKKNASSGELALMILHIQIKIKKKFPFLFFFILFFFIFFSPLFGVFQTPSLSSLSDLIFPHHACIAAQTEAATQRRPCAKFWIHTGGVFFKGQKMSKSIGNLVLLKDVLRVATGDGVRVMILMTKYQMDFEFEWDDVVRGEGVAEELRRALAVQDGSGGDGGEGEAELLRAAFVEAMEDDLDSPVAVAGLRLAARRIVLEGMRGAGVKCLKKALLECCQSVGLFLSGPNVVE